MAPPPKSDLRAAAREKRASLHHPSFAEALARHAEALGIASGAIVGGYHARKNEADPALLLEKLAGLGCIIAFPRVTGKDQPLEFHRVPDTEVLAPGAFGIHEPLSIWPVVTPAVLLVPLLAFDSAGHRLGYGGGFYDRTLSKLANVRAIGIAYAGQEIVSLPAEAHDMALLSILTEHGIRHFR
jgi:5-formyltetrahydrofolate cyclo-ligase